MSKNRRQYHHPTRRLSPMYPRHDFNELFRYACRLRVAAVRAYRHQKPSPFELPAMIDTGFRRFKHIGAQYREERFKPLRGHEVSYHDGPTVSQVREAVRLYRQAVRKAMRTHLGEDPALRRALEEFEYVFDAAHVRDSMR